MKERIKFGLIFFITTLLVMMFFCLSAAATENYGINYVITKVSTGDKYATVTGVDTYDLEKVYCVIPKSITRGGVNIPVTKIQAFAFEDCINLASVTIPESVKEIGVGAFLGCYNLKEINFMADYYSYCEGILRLIPTKVTGYGSYYANEQQAIYSACNHLKSFDVYYDYRTVLYDEKLDTCGCHSLKQYKIEIFIPPTEAELSNYDVNVYLSANNTNLKSRFEDSIYNINEYYVETVTDETGQDTYIYTINSDNTATIINCTTTSTVLTIPSLLGNKKVTKIGNHAFRECYSLKKVTVGDNITDIGMGAFALCKGLTDITISSSVKAIGDSAFIDCSSLENAALSEGIISLGDNIFSNCVSLTEVVVPDSVETLGRNAYKDCSSLEKVTLGTNLGNIREHTFHNCEKLTTIALGPNIESIGDYAFYKTAITRITFPQKVTSIGNNAFEKCSYLTRVQIRNGLESIGDYAFGDAIVLSQINLPNTITHIGKYAFYNCETLNSVQVPNITTIQEGTFKNCKSLSTVTINDVVEVIGSYAFSGCGNLENIELSPNLLSLNSFAFFDCIKIESIIIPDSTTDIGEKVFSGCTQLREISVPDTLNKLGEAAFENTNHINVTIRYVTGVIADSLFSKQNIEGLKLAEGITKIGNSTFSDNSIKNIVFPSTLLSIGGRSFKANLFNEVILPDGIEILGNYVFFDCENIDVISIPDSVVSIGDNALSGNVIIRNVDGQIDDELFYNQDITTAFVSDGCRIIGNNAFGNCEYLSEISIPDTVKTIKNNAFDLGEPKTLAIRAIDKKISNKLFMSTVETSPARNIDTIIVQDGIIEIGVSAFENSPVPNIIIQGNMETIANSAFKGSSTSSITILGYLHTIGDSAFENSTSLATLDIAGDLHTIGNRAFYNNESLSALSLPETVSEIGEYAFYNCNNLGSINLPSNISCIKKYTFYGCSSLRNVEIPEKITSIEDYAFYGCTSLSKVELNENLNTIGNFSFYNCSRIPSIVFPKKLKAIGEYAFRSCVSLTEVILPEGLIDLRDKAFYACTGLINVYLGNALEEIGDSVFYGCVSIEKAVLADDTTYIHDYAFYGSDYCILYCADNEYVKDYAEFNFLEYVDTSETLELIVKSPHKTEYKENENLDMDGFELIASYDGFNVPVYSGYDISGYDKTVAGEQTVMVTYRDRTATFNVSVAEIIQPEEPQETTARITVDNVAKSSNILTFDVEAILPSGMNGKVVVAWFNENNAMMGVEQYSTSTPIPVSINAVGVKSVKVMCWDMSKLKPLVDLVNIDI